MFELHTIIRIGQMLERGCTPIEIFVECAVVTPAFYEKGMPLAGYAYPLAIPIARAILEGTKEYAEFCKEYGVARGL